MTEIDLHLPGSAMENWTEAVYIKFKVAGFTYRDYTPFAWDAETSTCSLLVDTGHDGPGSQWAQSLRNGDTVYFFKAVSARQPLHAMDLVVALGDASSLAHLLALQQLTLPLSRFDGAVLLQNQEQQGLFKDYFRSPLQPIVDEAQMIAWLQRQNYCTDYTRFFLTGNHHLVNKLRRALKDMGHSRIRVKGFWS
ncbi:hypothetical protein [Mucilaginibacter sp. HD30]